jgi:DNA-binding transcriptional regulator YhcF (GntR family)
LRKIEKLKKVDADMLVLVDKNLACEKLADLERHAKLNVIYYQDKIPLAPILHHLEQAFREVKTKQVALVKDLRVVFTEPVVCYDEFAARIGVSPEAVKAALAEKQPEGYILMSNGVVRKDVLEQIHKRMEEQMNQKGKFHLQDAIRTIEAEGLEDATGALEILGYRVIWHGINSEEAEVVKA